MLGAPAHRRVAQRRRIVRHAPTLICTKPTWLPDGIFSSSLLVTQHARRVDGLPAFDLAFRHVPRNPPKYFRE
jgi:hypothetical protein